MLSKDNKSTTTPQQMCYVKIQQYFGTVEYSERDRDSNTVKKRFIDSWLVDKTLKEVTKLVVDQCSKLQHKGIQSVATVCCLSSSSSARCTSGRHGKAFHCALIANSNKVHAEWFLDWLANMVQCQYQKLNVAILLYV